MARATAAVAAIDRSINQSMRDEMPPDESAGELRVLWSQLVLGVVDVM